MGGGFGLEGMAVGMTIAALLNSASTREGVTTYLRIETEDAELHVLEESMEPQTLRILLSPLYVAVRNRSAR